jgi:hypothetical protein
MEAVKILERGREGLPGVRGARNAQMVAAGTGETLPGRSVLRKGAESAVL